MLDIQFIRDHTNVVKKAVEAKQSDPSIIDLLLEIDIKRRKLIQEIENVRAERNSAAREKNIEKGKLAKEKAQKLEPELVNINNEYKETLWKIPNIFSEDTPIGKDDSENKVIRKWGEPRKFEFTPKDHVQIGVSLKIIDIETAVKVASSRFIYLKGDAVLLQNALYQFAMSILMDRGVLKEIADKVEAGYSNKAFLPVTPPLMINPEIYSQMARLSSETEIERYAIPRDDLYLIGSAEHTLGPMHVNQVIKESELPVRYFAFTPAFRREAGSYGKDTKGILRVHQFDKIEMESFTTPETGMKEQDFFVGIQEYLMQKLEIPYQVVAICTGDMGGPDYRQFDIESWIPAQNKYRETHTADYMTDYQSRRLDTKVKIDAETKFVHMNDATVFAIGRTLIAILENYQNDDGSVNIPTVLRQWMGKEKIEMV